MSEKIITLARVNELLDQAVAEHGADYVYLRPDGRCADGNVTCLYWHGDAPGCIVGYVLHGLGVPAETLATNEGNSASIVLASLIDQHGWTIEDRDTVVNLLTNVQIRQDSGQTWGGAVASMRAASIMD